MSQAANAMKVPTLAITAVDGALSLLPAAMTSPEAVAMLYAIGLQESRFQYRRQLGNGPARGLWQFERGGGVHGVITHAASRYWVASLCRARGVKFQTQAVYAALEFDDVFAAGIARLLLFTDPRKLPALGEPDAAWNLYARVWRPGKPHRKTWPEAHAAANAAMPVPAEAERALNLA